MSNKKRHNGLVPVGIFTHSIKKSFMAYKLPIATIDTHFFHETYALARQAWLDSLESLSLPVQHAFFPCSGGGPDGDLLVTDVALLGAADAQQVVVLIAGTHGIEGFAGTAVQLDFMALLATGSLELPENTALLLIHALTPWGYAWLRRCDEEGVDLNRNIVDFSRELPVNQGYLELRPLLFAEDDGLYKEALAQWQQVHGRYAFELAVSGGQYHDAAGPFYGGTKMAHGHEVTLRIMEKFSLASKTLGVIDVHTGLGQFGYGEIICDHAPDSAGTAVANRWYGASVTLPVLGTSSSVPKSGLLDYAWHNIMNDQSCYVTLEFGTFSTDRLLEILLQDHKIWAQHDPLAAHGQHGKIMRQHFCPDDRSWQEMLLFRARQVIAQALNGIAT